MITGYNLYNFEASFRKFLIAENVNPLTLKNYLSDFRYFAGWMEQSNSVNFPQNAEQGGKNLTEHVTEKLLSVEKLASYKDFLVKSGFPRSSINRKLSTVRKFCSFCITQGWMKENPGKKVANYENNPSKHDAFELNDFKEYMMKDAKSDYPDNVISDIEEFFSFINS